MKKTHVLSTLLAMTMLLSLAACGSSSVSSSAKSVSTLEQASEISVEEAPFLTEEPTEAPGAEPEEVPVESEKPEKPEEPAEPEEPPVVIEYPISDGSVTFTFWNEMLGLFSSEMAEWNDNICMPYAEEATGIHENVITVTDMSAREQFSLMIASGDWPDFMELKAIPMSWTKTGSPTSPEKCFQTPKVCLPTWL